MEINCVFAPAMDTPDHIATAEEIGYRRAWVYDVPVCYADTGATLGIAATRTSTIRLGVSVLTPHLRHLVSNAALIAYLATLTPRWAPVSPARPIWVGGRAPGRTSSGT